MKKLMSLFVCFGLVCCLLTACGASSKSEYAYDQASPAEEPMAVEMEMAGNGAMLTEESGSTSNTASLPEARKWIITVRISAETDDLDIMTKALEEKIASMEGYVEDQSIHNGSAYAGRRYRSASMTVRIPAASVDMFTEDVGSISNVVSKTKNLEDVTLNYAATEDRVEALETEQARLLELLAQAETMSDLLEIEARLTEVRYELENYASRLRLYDNQIDYATIYLNIDEVQEYTPVEEPTLWERIREGFKDSVSGLGESLQDLLVFIVVAAPYVVIYGGILAVLSVPVRKLHAKRKARKAAKKDAREARKEE